MHLNAAQIMAIAPFLAQTMANPAPPQVVVDINEIHMTPPGGVIGDDRPRLVNLVHNFFSNDYICYLRSRNENRDVRECCRENGGRLNRQEDECVIRDVIFNPQKEWKNCAMDRAGYQKAECVKRQNHEDRDDRDMDEEDRRRHRGDRNRGGDRDNDDERHRHHDNDRNRDMDDDEETEERRRERDGNRSDRDRDGNRSDRDRDGTRSDRDRDGNRSDRDRDGNRSDRDRDGNRRDRDRDDNRRGRHGRDRHDHDRMQEPINEEMNNNHNRMECDLESRDWERDTRTCCHEARGQLTRSGRQCMVRRENEDDFIDCARDMGARNERCRRE